LSVFSSSVLLSELIELPTPSDLIKLSLYPTVAPNLGRTTNPQSISRSSDYALLTPVAGKGRSFLMTIHAYKNAAVSALALSMLACAAPAHAAGTDYLLKLGGVDGEVKEPKPQSADQKGRDKWIVLESVQLGAERTAGGVNVAAGDVNGDGVSAPRDVKTGQPSGKRARYPVHFHTMTDEETAALLLPAVQKVREAAMRTPAWEGCAAGQKIEGMTIKHISTGRTGQILDPVVVACATDLVSFNFTKIEWN
jgi:hypothetical protein